MRRSDREVTDKNRIESFVGEQKILRVGFCDDGEIYIVPVNYGYEIENENYVFFFHGAKAGRKYELARKNPEVGFEIDGWYELVERENACSFTARYQSIIGSGRLALLNSREEKTKALNLIMNQAAGKGDWRYSDKMLDKVAVFGLKVLKMTCKENKNA